MYTEEPAVFLSSGCIATMRTCKPERCCNNFTGTEGLAADFALILAITAIVVIDVMVGCPAQGTDGIFGNGLAIAALDRFNGFTILPLIVFGKKLVVLFDKGLDDRKLINLKFLIFRRMETVESPLFKRDISANKI